MSFFEDIWQWFGELSSTWSLSVQVFFILLLTLVLSFVMQKTLVRLHEKLKQTKNPWDDTLIDSSRNPASMLLWVLGIGFIIEIVHQDTQFTILEAIKPMRNVAAIYCITWFFVGFIRRAASIIINRENAPDKTSVEALGKLARLLIIIPAVLVSLETLGFSISGVLAFGGIGGIAIGFAAKDLLANFFGGLMIHLDRPFSVGDWIRSPDREIEGTVEDIGWRLTKIRTFDQRPLYLPNSIFSTIAVENPSRMSHRRIYETIGVRYDDVNKISLIVQDVKEMLLAHEEIDQTQTMIVNFNKFAPSSLDFFIYTFTRTKEWVHYHEVKEDVLLKVIDIIASHDAEVAFPTSTVHIPDGVQLPNIGDIGSL